MRPRRLVVVWKRRRSPVPWLPETGWLWQCRRCAVSGPASTWRTAYDVGRRHAVLHAMREMLPAQREARE